MFTVPFGWFAARATLLALIWTSGAFLKLEVPDVAVSGVATGCGFAVGAESEVASVAGCVGAGDSVAASGCVPAPVEADVAFGWDTAPVEAVADDSGCVAPEDASPEPCPIAVLPPSIVVPSLRPFVKLSLS